MTDLLTLDATDEGWSPDQLEAIKQLPRFKLFTSPFVAGVESVEGRTFKMLSCTASSTIEDLHGDNMTQECVTDMARQAQMGPQGKGLTIFLNHKYSAPEDVAGRVIQAASGPTGLMDGDTGKEIWDLSYQIRLTNNNDRVSQMYRQVAEDEISLGVSIGAYIQEYDYKDKDAGFWGGLIINKLLLVETSVVGIPANQRSWVQNGVMAVGKNLGLRSLFNASDDEPNSRLERRLWKVLDGKELAPLMKNLKIAETEPEETEGTPVNSPEEQTATPTVTDGDATPTNPATNTDGTESSEADAEATPVEESSADATTKSTDVDETDGETPEENSSALEEAAPSIALSLEAGTTPAVELVLAALEQAASELHAVRAEKATLVSQLEIVTGERDQAQKDVDSAAQIIAIVARSPLGRKTQFAAPIESFATKFGDIYDRAYLKLLEGE